MTTIKLKNGSGAPLAGDLVQGEPALDLTNKRLYTEDSGGTVIEVGTNPSTLTVDGDVGIGTASPQQMLHLSGSVPEIRYTDTTGNEYRAGNNNGKFRIYDQTAASDRLVIDSSGNVGIGTTSVTSGFKMEVLGDVRVGDAVGDDAVEMGWSAGSSQGFIQAYDRGASAFRALNLNNAVTITSAGNVGIGTTTINSGFVVDLGSLTVPAAGASTSCAMFGNSGSSGLYGTQIGALSTGTGYIQVQRADGTASTYDLLLQPNGGNVGIGTTSPSATLDLVGPSPTPVVLEINSANSNCDVTMQSASTSTATRLRNGTNDFQVHTNGTERMRIDSSGNVGIGDTTPENKVTVVDTDAGSGIAPVKARTSTVNGRASYQIGNDADNWFMGIDGGNSDAFFISDAVGSSDRLVITQSGNVMINTTTAEAVFNVYNTGSWIISSQTNGTGTVGHIRFDNGNGFVGSVTTSGSSTSFNTTSDYRLKENLVDLDNGIDRLKQIPVHRFNFIANPDTTVDGFLAHEVQDVIPEAVTGAKDAVDAEGNPEYQGIDQSKLVPLLTAALQEAVTRMETLEAEVAALKGA